MNDASNDYHLFFFFDSEEVDISNRDFLIFRGMDIVRTDRSNKDCRVLTFSIDLYLVYYRPSNLILQTLI